MEMEGSNKAAPDDIENPQIPSLETSIREELGSLSPLSSDCCIFRVPERLRHPNVKAYEPTVVSIGPLHHGKEALRAMEEHKGRYLQHFLEGTRVSLENFLQKIRSQEADIRNCYAETIDMTSDKFVKIILMDAAFILELLLRCYFEEYGDQGDRIFNKPMMIGDIWLDMLLLENQLPFFILKDLLDLHNPEAVSSNSSTNPVSIGNLSLNFLYGPLIARKVEYRLERLHSSHAQVKHLVDFMRQLCLPLEPRAAGKLKNFNIPSITDLHQAGVTFEMVPNETADIFDLDIQFTDGVLKIPKFTIQDRTEVLLRNLVAFEECNAMEHHITDYVAMMDRFVNTTKDVDLLVKNDIIENLLGDNAAVSTMINDAFSKGLTINRSQFYYAAVCEGLNKYYNLTWHKWKANLRQNYFNTPWATISVIAAVFLIILTMIQTVCSIISL